MGGSQITRVCGNKVRTGCLTCKSRHLKCDEARPNCRKCVAAKRNCEGYAPAKSHGRAPVKRHDAELTIIQYNGYLPSNPSTAISTDMKERRSFDYFRRCTAPNLMSCFSSELWSLHVLRLAHQEPGVRHAAIAMGSLHEQFVSEGRFPDSRFALQQYNVAIQHVLESFKSSSSYTPDIAMLLCALFASFECLQGRLKRAHTHIASGIKLIQERRENATNTTVSRIPEELFNNVFSDLAAQVVELADPSTKSLQEQNPVLDMSLPETFDTLEEAHSSFGPYLFKLMRMLYNVRDKTRSHGCLSPDEVKAMMVENQNYVRFYELWSKAYDSFLSQRLGVNPSSIRRSRNLPSGIYILQIHRTIVRMLFSLDHSKGEPSWDPLLHEMESIIELVEIFLDLESRSSRSPSPRNGTRQAPKPTPAAQDTSSISISSSSSLAPRTSTSPTSSRRPSSSTEATTTSTTSQGPLPIKHNQTFSVSIGIIIPLYLVATRCRDPTLRRRAIHLLATCNRREGVWDASVGARVCQRVLELEESAARQRLCEEAVARALYMGAGAGAEVDVDLLSSLEVISMHQIPRELRIMSMGSSFSVPRLMTVRMRRDERRETDPGWQPVVFEEHFPF